MFVFGPLEVVLVSTTKQHNCHDCIIRSGDITYRFISMTFVELFVGWNGGLSCIFSSMIRCHVVLKSGLAWICLDFQTANLQIYIFYHSNVIELL